MTTLVVGERALFHGSTSAVRRRATVGKNAVPHDSDDYKY